MLRDQLNIKLKFSASDFGLVFVLNESLLALLSSANAMLFKTLTLKPLLVWYSFFNSFKRMLDESLDIKRSKGLKNKTDMTKMQSITRDVSFMLAFLMLCFLVDFLNWDDMDVDIDDEDGEGETTPCCGE